MPIPVSTSELMRFTFTFHGRAGGERRAARVRARWGFETALKTFYGISRFNFELSSLFQVLICDFFKIVGDLSHFHGASTHLPRRENFRLTLCSFIQVGMFLAAVTATGRNL